MFWDFPSMFSSSMIPEVDILESQTHYRLAASLPQVNKESLKVTPEADHTICISGTREIALPDDHMQYKALLRERSNGAFQRCLRFPKKIVPEGIKAEMRKEELVMMIPKENYKPSTDHIDVVHSE